MSLELLLSLSCWFSTPPYVYSNNLTNESACLKMGEGYYVYSKLDEQVKEIERNTPHSIIFTATLLSSIEKRKASLPIYGGSYFSVEFPDRESKVTLGLQHGF